MKRKANFIIQKIGGKTLLLPLDAHAIDMNGIISLNDTAAWVWELLAEDRSLEQLTAMVAERFDVPPATAHADVQTFINEIAKMGLLVL